MTMTDEIETVRHPFDTVHDLVREWCEAVTDHAEGYDGWSHRVEEIEHEWRDGFIPYTAGGWEGIVNADLSHAHGSGCIPRAIQPYLDTAEKELEAAWNEQHPERTVDWLYAEDEGQGDLFGGSDEREHWRERFWEFQDEWLREGGTYFYKIRAIYHDNDTSTRSESGEPEILFCVGINTDFEYGRDHIPWLACYGGNPQCTTWTWERTVKVSDLTPALLAELEAQAREGINKC